MKLVHKKLRCSKMQIQLGNDIHVSVAFLRQFGLFLNILVLFVFLSLIICHPKF